MTIRFGLTLPGHFWQLDFGAKQALLERIYQFGFGHVYTADHVSFRNGAGSDGFVHTAAASQLHPSLGVMISVYLLPLRHPVPVARQIATLAAIAPGRFVFGVGIGGEDRHEIEVCGVDPATRGRRTDESLDVIRRLLAGERVTFDGAHFKIEDASIRPAPDPHVPLVVGGRSDAALRRAGRYGDGWIGVWCSPDRYRKAIDIVDATARAHGRRTGEWHGYQPWVGVAADRERARAAVAEQMERFYHLPFSAFERYTPYGTPADVAAALLPYVEAGSRLFNLKVCCAPQDDEPELAAAVRGELLRMTGAE